MDSQQKNDFIRDWYSDCSAKVLSDYLGISVHNVYARANRMKLARDKDSKPVITSDDVALIKELSLSLPYKEIAVKFNLTLDECSEIIYGHL